jgi:hypothetical protein
MEFTEKTILERLYGHFNTHKYQLSNVYMFDWESDLFSITKSGYCWEFEIKISRSDFKADSKKIRKHSCLKRNNDKFTVTKGVESDTTFDCDVNGNFRLIYYPSCQVYINRNIIPNRFFYVVPDGMIDKSEVPKYAGLIYINDNGFLSEVKNAPILHREKLDLSGKLVDKLYYRNIDLRNKIAELEREIDDMNLEIEI